MHIVIVGGGIIGLGAAWALEGAGHRVSLLERGSLPNPLGSSVDRHRLIRYAYGDQVGYMRMVAGAYRAWDAVWHSLGSQLYVETGTLAVAGEQAGWYEASLKALTGDGHEVGELSQAQAAEKFPLIDFADARRIFHLPSGGVLLADRIVHALARYLIERGARLRAHSEVVAIDAARASATLASGEIVAGDMVVVAAGPWITKLVPSLAPRVVASRQTVAYLRPPPELRQAWSRHAMILDIGSGFYLVPSVTAPDLPGMLGGDTGLKIGDHSFSRQGDPDRQRLADPAESAPILAQSRARLRGLDRYQLVQTRTCFYTVADDERFVAEKIGPAAWALSCCSGHGFKFGPVIGQAVAALVDGKMGDGAFSQWIAGATDIAAPF